MPALDRPRKAPPASRVGPGVEGAAGVAAPADSVSGTSVSDGGATVPVGCWSAVLPCDPLIRGADDEDDAESEPEPVDPPEPVRSANAIGIATTAEPTPNATAKAPTRPTYRAQESAPGSASRRTTGGRYSIPRIRRPAERPVPEDEAADIVVPFKHVTRPPLEPLSPHYAISKGERNRALSRLSPSAVEARPDQHRDIARYTDFHDFWFRKIARANCQPGVKPQPVIGRI